MKFQLTATLLAFLASANARELQAEETDEEAGTDAFFTGEDILQRNWHDGSVFNETVVYDGTCLEQSYCLGLTVVEVQRRCGSGSCEYYVCYDTDVGEIPANTFINSASAYLRNGYGFSDATAEAAQDTIDVCKLHPDYGVDYAGNMGGVSPGKDYGGCINEPNSKGKGLWDETCINPETTDEEGIAADTVRFSSYCQVVAPGHTVHFLMHSYNRLDWNGDNPEPVSCSGTAEVFAPESDLYGKASCAPSSSSPTNANGQTYFPATDGSSGGTCSEQPEGEECVWTYTAPNYCKYEENLPTCALSQDSVDSYKTVCPGSEIVEYFEHDANPNAAPPRVPFHNIVQNGDGTVSFQIYNPYGNYSEPIDYGQLSSTADDYKYGPGGEYDLVDLYVVYDQANEIGNEVCDLETAAGKCGSDNTYTAKCRTDGVAVVTMFASGFDASSAAAQQAEAGGAGGTDVFDCCPDTYEPPAHYNKEQTAAWTYIIHCDCPTDEARRQLREDVSSKFQKGELFSENQKKLHKML